MAAPSPVRPVLTAACAAVFAAALAGCSSLEPIPGFEVSEARWNARVAHAGVDLGEAPNPMALTPEMRGAARALAGAGDPDEKLERLRAALLDGRAYTFEYEKSSTFTAMEAFESRRGNCVSFTNLFIALGRSLGIRLQAALVMARGSSEREGDLIVTYNHMVAVHPFGSAGAVRIYDFFGVEAEAGGSLRLLDDLAVAAIRASNRGVKRLGRGEPEEARLDFETAVKLAPSLGSLHANLGLARWRAGDLPGALAAFRRGLEIDPSAPQLHQNLAAFYVEQGRPAEARAALAALNVRQASPYAFIVRGNLALDAGDVKAALRDYRSAAALDDKLAEPWVAIARAELARGRPEAARKAAKKALARDPENAGARRMAEAPP